MKLTIEAPRVTLSHNQLLVERVMYKTLTQYKLDVVITDCLRSLFTYKLMRMRKLGRTGKGWPNWKMEENNLASQIKSYRGQRSKKHKTFFVQKKTAWLQEDLESCQPSLKNANMKLQKVKEKHQQFVTSLGPKKLSIINLGQNTVHDIRSYKKQLVNDVCTTLKFTE